MVSPTVEALFCLELPFPLQESTQIPERRGHYYTVRDNTICSLYTAFAILSAVFPVNVTVYN